MAGPYSYSADLADSILERLAEGESLRSICSEPGMPSRNTVRRWEDMVPEFGAKCARARQWQADSYVDKMDDLCNRVEGGELEAKSANVILASLQWRAAKLAPKRYSERQMVEMTGRRLEDASDAELAAIAFGPGGAGSLEAAASSREFDRLQLLPAPEL